MNHKMLFRLAAAIAAMIVVGEVAAQSPGTPGRRNGLLGNRNLGRNARQAQAPKPATPTASAAAAGDSGTSSLNFNAAPLDMVFETYSRMVNKTILKDPNVPNPTITLKSESGQVLTNEEQIEAIEVVLEMNGVHLEPYGEKFIRALPRKDARKEGIPLIMDEKDLDEGNKVVSMMFRFQNIGTEEAQKALEGLKSASGILLVFERTSSILVTDTQSNINRMREIARMIDVASPVTEIVEYIQIKNASATEIKQVIDNIVQEAMKEQEKSGKTSANQNHNAASSNIGRPLLGGIRRPGQNNNNNQPAQVNNESMVTTVSDADRGMIRGKVVTIADERSNKILIITNASNMKFFKEVIAALDVETTPDTVVKVYRLKYAEAEDVSDMINDLIGNSSSSKGSGKSNQNQNAKNGTSGSATRGTQQARKPANQRSGEAKAGELNKENTTVLADKRINGLVVMTQKELVPTIEQIIESMDIKLSQVLIETVIIEVGLGDGITAGIDWISRGKTSAQAQMQNALGQNMYYAKQTVSDTDGNSKESVLSTVVPEGYKSTSVSDDTTTTIEASEVKAMITSTARDAAAGFANYYTGGAYSMGGGSTGGNAAMAAMAGIATNTFNKTGFNFIWQSDKLNLGAIIQATKTDSHSKYIASPIIMTLDNKEATIEATEMRYLFKGYQYSGSTYSGSPVKDYEQKELGITIKVTPKINPNGTVMLTLEEEYSQEGAGQKVDGENQATTVTRKMSADALLENNQTVCFAGLTQTMKTESESGIPFLKDIPYIGRWLFGSIEDNETRSELLVFMTPYVLDDADAAEAEALRRKKAISDTRAWDDHGWSLSKLADPVSKKEQMRRLKDEWKKQDEERRTKIAIEKAKVDRAKALKELSKDERDLWLQMHKEELESDQRDELTRKMLDKDSQEELKKLAEKVRKDKLTEAEKELKSMEEKTSAENERGKLDAEKAAKEKEKSEREAQSEESAFGEVPAPTNDVEAEPGKVKKVEGVKGVEKVEAVKKVEEEKKVEEVEGVEKVEPEKKVEGVEKVESESDKKSGSSFFGRSKRRK